MMTAFLFLGTIFEWLATTKIGRIVALVGVVAIVLVIAFFKIKAMGRAEERERNKKITDKLIDKKEKLDADIADDTSDERDRRVRPWIRG